MAKDTISKFIEIEDAQQIIALLRLAATRRRRCNVFLTYLPGKLHDQPLDECDLSEMESREAHLIDFVDRVEGLAITMGFPPVAAWFREAQEDGSGEHVHVLSYVPRKLYDQFASAIHAWDERPSAIDVRPANLLEPMGSSGEPEGLIYYFLKSVSRRDLRAIRSARRSQPGLIYGQRCGVSAGLVTMATRPAQKSAKQINLPAARHHVRIARLSARAWRGGLFGNYHSPAFGSPRPDGIQLPADPIAARHEATAPTIPGVLASRPASRIARGNSRRDAGFVRDLLHRFAGR